MNDQANLFAEPRSHDGIVSRELKPARFHGAHLTDADVPRLTAQQQRVWAAVKRGGWLTVDDVVRRIYDLTGTRDPATSVDRQLRYLRAMGLAENRRVSGALYAWRLTETKREAA